MNLLPRRLLGKQIRLCDRLLGLLDKETKSQYRAAMGALQESIANGDSTYQMEFVDQKLVKKVCDLQSKLMPLLVSALILVYGWSELNTTV